MIQTEKNDNLKLDCSVPGEDEDDEESSVDDFGASWGTNETETGKDQNIGCCFGLTVFKR